MALSAVRERFDCVAASDVGNSDAVEHLLVCGRANVASYRPVRRETVASVRVRH